MNDTRSSTRQTVTGIALSAHSLRKDGSMNRQFTARLTPRHGPITRVAAESRTADAVALVNKANPCRCPQKTKGFIEAGHVDLQRLLFAGEHFEQVRQVASETVSEIDNRTKSLSASSLTATFAKTTTTRRGSSKPSS